MQKLVQIHRPTTALAGPAIVSALLEMLRSLPARDRRAIVGTTLVLVGIGILLAESR